MRFAHLFVSLPAKQYVIMKNIVKILLAVFMLSLVPTTYVCAQEIVLECKYKSMSQELKCLIVYSRVNNECVVKANNAPCHYDLQLEKMGDNLIFHATNPSLSSWVNVLYIIGEEDKNIIFVPSYLNGHNTFPLTYTIIDEENHAKKKREYGMGQVGSPEKK